jgi:hypothetical protein
VLVTVPASAPVDVPAGAVRLAQPPVVTQTTPDGAVLTWRTTAAADAVVTVGRRRTSAGRTDRPSVRVGGLRPGQRADYRLLAGGREIARGSFRTSPPPSGPRSSFRAAVFGDHGSGNQHQRAVVRLTSRWRPDLTVTTGDNVYPFALPALVERRFFRPLAPLLRSSTLVPALGNHDVALTGGRALLGALALPGAERWYVQRYGSAAFVVLDSDEPLAPGTPQGRFLARAVRETRDACFRIAVFHHPPWSPHSEGIAPHLREHLVPVLERAGFTLALLGHDHVYDRSRPRRGVTYVIVGTGGAEIGDRAYPGLPSARSVTGTYGALRLDVAARVATARFQATDGRVLDRFTLRCRPG